MHLVLLERFDYVVRHCRVLGYFVIFHTKKPGSVLSSPFPSAQHRSLFLCSLEEPSRLWRVLKTWGERGRACSARWCSAGNEPIDGLNLMLKVLEGRGIPR